MHSVARRHVHEEELPVSPAALFAVLHTPSAIRGWWGAARAVVLPRVGGAWIAAWGESEDDPDYVTAGRILAFDPPRLMTLGEFQYHAKIGAPPFDMSRMTTTFVVEPRSDGGRRNADGAGSPDAAARASLDPAAGPRTALRVEQDGFPCDPAADAFYAACEIGWKNTFEGIRRYLAR